jgi:hypothetical protein
VQAYPVANIEIPQLTWQNNKPGEIQRLGENKWQFKPTMADMTLIEGDGYQLLNINNSQSINSSMQKTWWHTILSNKGAYLSPYSQVQKVTVKAVNGSQYWWIWLLIGAVFASILKITIPTKKS